MFRDVSAVRGPSHGMHEACDVCEARAGDAVHKKLKRRADVLPYSLPPRGLSRLESAAYIGISPTKFDEMVEDGRMPAAKMIDSRRVWDRHALDVAFNALPGADQEASDWD